MQRQKNINFPRTMLILVIALILIGNFTLTTIISFQNSKNVLRESLINDELPQVSDRIYSEIKLDLLPHVFGASALADNIFIREWIRNGEIDKGLLVQYLDDICTEYHVVTCFLVSDNSSTYYNPNGSFNISEDDPDAGWYFSFRDSGKMYELNNTVNLDMDNMPTVFINYRMVDASGEFIGAAGFGLELDSIPGTLEQFQDDFERHVYFVDSQGSIITRSEGAMMYQNNLYNVPELQDVVEKIFTGSLGSFEYKISDEIMLVNTRYIPELDWWILIEQKESEILEKIYPVLIKNALVNLAAISLTMLLVIFAVTYFNKQLEKMASTDRLTGAINRQMFEYALKQAIVRYSRSPASFSVIFIDIDQFKKVNDGFGHLKGDQVLQRVAHIIQSSIRKADDFSRWGGEEFIILAYDCDLQQGVKLAEKIRKVIKSEFGVYLPDHGPVTVSIGVSEVKADDNEDSLLNRADKALYQAKEQGRDCVSFL